jgi:hypothetical protein
MSSLITTPKQIPTTRILFLGLIFFYCLTRASKPVLIINKLETLQNPIIHSFSFFQN